MNRLSRRTKVDLATGASVLIYVTLVLALSITSPALNILFIGLAAYQMIAGRSR